MNEKPYIDFVQQISYTVMNIYTIDGCTLLTLQTFLALTTAITTNN